MRFLPVTAAAVNHRSNVRCCQQVRRQDDRALCRAHPLVLSPVCKDVAHDQLPLSDHRGHSSGYRSNEQSHRCCGSCKSYSSLRLRFWSRCITVVLRRASFLPLLRRLRTCRVRCFSFWRCGQLCSHARSNVRLMSLIGRCRSPQHHHDSAYLLSPPHCLLIHTTCSFHHFYASSKSFVTQQSRGRGWESGG